MKFSTVTETPKVSICILTYNHEKYIKEALDSVLMQETKFSCEIIVAEDCSQDKTREILLSYASRYPLKLIVQEKNIGAICNLKNLLDAPVGKYVAYLEGDDHWNDPLKLQKQFDLLEEHPEAVLCYTNAKIFDTQNPDSNIYFGPTSKPPVYKTSAEAVLYCPMPTCTLFFRNLLKPFPDWALPIKAGDYLMVALLCKFGGILYLDNVTALHNHHYLGLSRTIPLADYCYTDGQVIQNLYKHYEGNPAVSHSITARSIGIVDSLFHMAQFKKAISLFWKIGLSGKLNQSQFRMQLTKLTIKIHLLHFLSKRKTYRVPNAPVKI